MVTKARRLDDPRSIARRRFTMADQEAFAALSGDRNPMHLDPVYARRTQEDHRLFVDAFRDGRIPGIAST